MVILAGIHEQITVFTDPGWRWLHAIVGVVFLGLGIAAFTDPFRRSLQPADASRAGRPRPGRGVCDLDDASDAQSSVWTGISDGLQECLVDRRRRRALAGVRLLDEDGDDAVGAQ